MKKPKVLIIAAMDDLHAEAVSQILLNKNLAEPVILDFALIPKDIYLNFSKNESFFESDTLRINLESIVSIWWRRPQLYRIPKDITTEDIIDFCYVNTQQAVEGMLLSTGKPIINDPFVTRKADHKVYQLNIAHNCGLFVPETLVTNDPKRAKDFVERLWESGNEVISKCIQRSRFHYAPTRLLTMEDINLMHTINYAPSILQERITNAYELRITIIGDKIFAAKCISQKPEAEIDIRFDLSQDITKFELPLTIQEKLLKLMSRLELTYAAIDMFFKPPDQYFFIEINPSGQYLYVEIPTLMPISETLAYQLAK